MPESIQIHPNCTYKIQVHAYPRVKPEGKLSEVIYTVPECVGRKCCAGAKDTLPIPTVEAIQMTGKVIINWYVRSNSNVHSYAISIGTPLFTSNAGHSVYNITRISNVTSTINTFTWNSRLHNQYIQEKNSYKIFVEAIDHRGCLGTRGDFTINTTSYGNIIWIFIGVIICITILGFVSQYFVSLYNKNDQYQLLQLPRILRRRQTMSELSDCKLQWPEETCCKVYENNNEFEISYKCISLQHELGKGQFGRVYLGTLNNNMDTLVAVKMSQCSDTTNEPEARRQLLEEIETMKTAGPHPYLVGLIGYCTSPDDPICILLEYMEGGNLLAYLHSRRKMEPNVIPLCNFEKPVSRYVNIIKEDRFKDEDLHYKIEKQQFVEFALNIAKGMEHLESKGITHRDLAARNILLTLDLTPKISDFGLSRNGIYVINNTGKVHQLPIRWMSPEAVRDHIFSSKSDVWSFGIVLWEIGTLGSFPYPNIKDEDLLHYLTQDKCRLTCPDTISYDIYEIMCSCWKTAPQGRPSFAQLVLDLQILKESLYSVHDASNPCYMLLSQ
ncbi:fibroblast growth factor receptor-like isoform X2 [Odontomachus brunneus]|nr:fibroblast growth factor receptor-like isoform X2 [Odontomachus brunneus]